MADAITGLQFVFEHTAAPGFAQGTIVKPNIIFEAAATLRDGVTPTSVVPTPPADPTPTTYHNVAIADGEGVSGGEPVYGDEVQDNATAQIIAFPGGGGTGPGENTLLSDKDWVSSNWVTNLNNLASQSAATARTAHGWGVAVPGYDRVVLSDALPLSEGAAGSTVFQAFDLTGIRPITFANDPLLQWDQVILVEIYVGGAWTPIAAPGGSWMDASGFKGYSPTGANLTTLRSATGVRVTIEPNDVVREASTLPGRPAPGAGVAWGATERPFGLQWQLRNSMRVPLGSGWVTASQSFNEPDLGTIRNDFRVAGTAGTDTFTLDTSDTIILIDNQPGVATSKVANPTAVIVPAPEDVDPTAYPTVRFTVDAWNTVASRASYIRVTDPLPCATAAACVAPGNDFDPDVFTGNLYDPATNPFALFTITNVSFVVPGTVPIDQAASNVALWRYNEAAGTTSVDLMSMSALDGLDAAALADVVGIGIVYQSTNPGLTGGLIPQGNVSTNHIRMVVDTILRETVRSSNGAEYVTAGEGGLSVDNDTIAQSYDPILWPSATPYAEGLATVRLTDARLDVTAAKGITPSTILETAPDELVTVTLGATDGLSTAAAETVTITDVDVEFWDAFAFDALGTITRPAGADLAQVDVQLDDDPTWILGTAAASPALPGSLLPEDLERITGIRVLFFNDPAEPFSATAPPADWSAEVVFTVRLRDGVEFPRTVENTVEVLAEHRDLPSANAQAIDDITLSLGTPRIDVQKEAVTGNGKIVEPGVSYPWTLEFRNIGTAFIPVNEVIDDLGPDLRYDGSEPTYETNAAAMPTTGITLSQATEDEITFDFPDDSVLAPGEWYRITVNLVLQPGLLPDDEAVNAFLVDTGVNFAPGDCVNLSGNGRGILDDVLTNQCGTTNVVSPQAGPLLLAEKEVRGEIDGDLVDGAGNVTNPELLCTPSTGGFFKSTCAAYTVIGATDEWRIGGVNTGTIPYTSLTFVDELPTVGDRLLATGSARGSDWRPVFDLGFGIQPDENPDLPGEGIPSGTSITYEVTTGAAPCTGAGPGTAWPANPTCDTATWVELSSYAGAAEDITAIRTVLDFSETEDGALNPGGSIHFLYRTVNTPWEEGDIPTAEAVHPQLTSGPSLKAWNQVGAVATLLGLEDTIQRAPARVGVQLLTGSASVEKTVSGEVDQAPAEVTVDVECTVPGGVEDGRAAVDLGLLSTLTVPVGGVTRLDGIPLGAQCQFEESGPLGTFGETMRTPDGPQVVDILVPGTETDPVPVAQSVTIDNWYDGEELAATGVDVRLLPLFALLLLIGGLVLRRAPWRTGRLTD